MIPALVCIPFILFFLIINHFVCLAQAGKKDTRTSPLYSYDHAALTKRVRDREREEIRKQYKDRK